MTAQAATSPTAHSCSNRVRRCLSHLKLERGRPRFGGWAPSRERSSELPSAGLTLTPRQRGTSARSITLGRRLGPEAHDAGELARALDDEGGQARLLGQDALAGGPEHEAGYDLTTTVEDRRGETGRALSDLVGVKALSRVVLTYSWRLAGER